MNSFSGIDGTNIKVLVFDEDQTAQISAALMLAAEGITTAPQRIANNLYPGDVVDLLSDSDDDSLPSSDCEILGYLTNDGEPLHEVAQPIKEENEFVEEQCTKIEIDADCVDFQASTAFEEVHFAAGNPLFSESSEMQMQQNNEFQLEAEFLPAVATQNEYPIGGAEVLTVSSTDDSGTDVASEDSQSHQPYIDASEASGAKMAQTFGTDDLEIDYDEEINKIQIRNLDDEITELENSSDNEDNEDMDHETEMKLIELIDSDAEDNILDEAAARGCVVVEDAQKTIDMLIHYNCPECGNPCGSFKKWKAHTDSEHDFRSIDKLNIRTIVNRDGELQNQCRQCMKKFKGVRGHYLMLRHRISHLPFRNYFKCRLCPQSFKSRSGLRSHLQRLHKKICREYLLRKRTSYDRIAFHCPICNTTKADHIRLAKHLKQKHDSSASLQIEFLRSNANYYKPFRCRVCSEEYYTLTPCLRHVRLKHNPSGEFVSSCTYCDLKFRKPKERDAHMREQHQTKMLKCEICEMEFYQPSALLQHMDKSYHRKMK